ncbi:At-Rich Interactive Domain-Containing Protein 2, partial [Manis pentadactyla]
NDADEVTTFLFLERVAPPAVAHLLQRSLLPATPAVGPLAVDRPAGGQLLPALPPPNLLSSQLLQDHVLPADLCGLLLPAHLLWVWWLGVQLLPTLLPPNLLSNQLLQDHLLPADLCDPLLPALLLWV